MKKIMFTCISMLFSTNIKSSDHQKSSLEESRRNPVLEQVVEEQRNEERDMARALMLLLMMQDAQENRGLGSGLEEARNPFVGMLGHSRLEGFGLNLPRRMEVDVHQEECAIFMQGLRNLSQEDKDLVLRLMDESEFSSDTRHSLDVMEEISKVFKRNRLRRHGDYTTIRFVLKGEQESRSEDGERYAQREIAQGLRSNVYGEISKSELERRAHRQEFEEFVAGLKAMGGEDRDQVLELLDKHDFDTSLSTSQGLELFEQVDHILHKNKIRRNAGMQAVRHILEKEKAKQA